MLLRFGVESLVLVVGHADVGTVANEAHGMSDEMALRVGWQPELVVHELLIEGKVTAFANAEKAETQVEIVVEARNHAADLTIFFVDP